MLRTEVKFKLTAGISLLQAYGNHFAAGDGGLKDLMARMGHDSERAAVIYWPAGAGADETLYQGNGCTR